MRIITVISIANGTFEKCSQLNADYNKCIEHSKRLSIKTPYENCCELHSTINANKILQYTFYDDSFKF